MNMFKDKNIDGIQMSNGYQSSVIEQRIGRRHEQLDWYGEYCKNFAYGLNVS